MFLHLLACAMLLALIFLVLAPASIVRRVSLVIGGGVPRYLQFDAVIIIAIIILPVAALAQSATPVTEPAVAVGTIPLSPWVAFIKPYLDMIVTTLVGVLVTFAVAKLNQYFGTKIQQTNVDRIKSSLATDAGALVAAAADNISTKVLTVNSPVVTQIANAAADRLPDVIKAAGVTPERLREMAVGEIGKLQAVGNVAAPPAPAK